jgi:hypothetical protein
MSHVPKLTLHDVVTVCNESDTDGEGHYSDLPERNSLPEESAFGTESKSICQKLTSLALTEEPVDQAAYMAAQTPTALPTSLAP